jgi:uncharacterized protein YgbK (DUF1537 family)
MNNWLANWGQLVAGLLALLAAAIGIWATYASNQLRQASNAELVKAAKIITRLEHQVTVIGGEWPPLTSEQIEALRTKISAFDKPSRIQVMYENKFGKELAQSIANAFRAARWGGNISVWAGERL